MQDIEYTVNEYEESRAIIKNRIHELNAQINKSASCKEDSSVKRLLERRSIMYTQLWDIEYAIRELRDYLCVTIELEVNQNAG